MTYFQCIPATSVGIQKLIQYSGHDLDPGFIISLYVIAIYFYNIKYMLV